MARSGMVEESELRGNQMGLNTFAHCIARLALATLGASALHAIANPIDTDNDRVFDDFDDCPNQYGSPCHKGCPSPPGEECVISYGTMFHSALVECPDGLAAVGYPGCRGYDAGWGTFYVAVFSGSMSNPGTYSYTVELADEDGDGVLDEDDKCKDKDGPSSFEGCPGEVYCSSTASEGIRFGEECFDWNSKQLESSELTSYFSEFRAFVNNDCGNAFFSHWACRIFSRYLRPGDVVTIPSWTDRWTRMHYPPNCPDGYFALSSTNLFGGFSLPIYSGSCMSTCKAALFHAGLISSVAFGGAPAVATSVAGRGALASAGIISGTGVSSTVIFDICDVETYIEGTYD